MSRQFIIAGRSAEASIAAHKRTMTPDQYSYVNGAEDLRGLRAGSTVWLVGTYYERKDYDELAELCAARDIGLVHV